MIATPRVHYRLIDSTNRRARELAAYGAPHGTVVTADEQSAGRGRLGNRWSAPARQSVLMSLLVREPVIEQGLLALAAGCATCAAIERVAGVRCALKWPNDVLIDGRKVSGILLEGRPQEAWVVVGIGVNVFTTSEDFEPDLRGRATSLALAAPGVELTVDALLESLLDELAGWLKRSPEDICEAWRRRDWLYDRRIRWAEGEGTAKGISDSGGLLVDTDRGRISLYAGDVHLAV